MANDKFILGASIQQVYLVRKQRTVAVNETDLEELLSFEILQQGLMGVGLFLVSGALWLGIEKLLEQDSLVLTPLLSLCIASTVAGITLFIAGACIFIMRRKKVRKIFSEVTELPAEA